MMATGTALSITQNSCRLNRKQGQVADDRHETTLQIQIQCKLNLMVMAWIS
jgi:hypothetical protein